MSDDKFSYKKELDDLIGEVKGISKVKTIQAYEEPNEEIMKKVEDSTIAYEKQHQQIINKKNILKFMLFVTEYKNYDFEKVNDFIINHKLTKDDLLNLTEERLDYFDTISNYIYNDKLPKKLIPNLKLNKPLVFFHDGDTSILKSQNTLEMLTLNFEKEEETVSKKLKDDLDSFFIDCKLNKKTVIISSNEKYSELALKLASKYSVNVINILPCGVDYIRDCENEFNILNISPFINDKKIDFNTIDIIKQYKNEIKNNFKEQVFEDIDPKYKKKKKGVER